LIIFRVFIFSARSFYYGKYSFPVRVKIVDDVNKLRVSSTSPCDITDLFDNSVLGSDYELKSVEITGYRSGIKVGDIYCKNSKAKIDSGIRGAFKVNGVEYRGSLLLIRSKKGVDVINVVELEDYLKGVLPREVNRLWPFGALKAQAIASRSYAVNQALRRKSRDYDLRGDTFSQVYGGKSAERWRTSSCVENTRGKVLAYAGKVFPAFFHSCCGGHTQDARKVWGEGLPPLEGVRCKWCKWSKHFRWKTRISPKDVAKKLKNAGYEFKRMHDIKAGTRDRSGRLDYVSVKADNRWFEIKGSEFISDIGGGALKSTNFRVRKNPFFYSFTGHGWGHGVGMCQWGAFWLGLRRWRAERILAYYYPDTEIVELKDHM